MRVQIDPKKKERSFRPGTVVVFDPKGFNPEYWDNLSEDDRLKYYGALGYGKEKPELFVFLTEIRAADGSDSGHCVLVSLSDQHIETMRHPEDFRAATDEEF